MDLKLSGRTARITGSSKGIGLAVAQWFAREGVNVCLVARSAELLEKEAAAIGKTLALKRARARLRLRLRRPFHDALHAACWLHRHDERR